MGEFYVYAYLDPRKPGKYVYGEYNFDFEPFYVGKGCGKRLYTHLYPYQLEHDTNMYKNNRLKKLIQLGYDLKDGFIIKLHEGLTDANSISKEIKITKKIGRLNLGKGPLLNLTDGGGGTANPSKETREKMSKAKLGHKISKSHLRKLATMNTGRIKSPEELLKISEKNRHVPLDIVKKVRIHYKKFGSYNKAARDFKIDHNTVKKIVLRIGCHARD